MASSTGPQTNTIIAELREAYDIQQTKVNDNSERFKALLEKIGPASTDDDHVKSLKELLEQSEKARDDQNQLIETLIKINDYHSRIPEVALEWRELFAKNRARLPDDVQFQADIILASMSSAKGQHLPGLAIEELMAKMDQESSTWAEDQKQLARLKSVTHTTSRLLSDLTYFALCFWEKCSILEESSNTKEKLAYRMGPYYVHVLHSLAEIYPVLSSGALDEHEISPSQLPTLEPVDLALIDDIRDFDDEHKRTIARLKKTASGVTKDDDDYKRTKREQFQRGIRTVIIPLLKPGSKALIALSKGLTPEEVKAIVVDDPEALVEHEP
ncbi:hypothetical protein NX059_012412 [Plenodomus lindquistii]|nr:hypothetical protein NX059_012412 [Plenodomus lindquistii]